MTSLQSLPLRLLRRVAHKSVSQTCKRFGARLVPDRSCSAPSWAPMSTAALPKGKGVEELVGVSCNGACSKDTPKLSDDELDQKMLAVPLWKLNDARTEITRSFTARNWGAAMDFLNKLSVIAEEEGHHPDIHLQNYRDVRVVVSTHAIGGLSIFDFVLAAKIDTVEVDYSPKWLRTNYPDPEAAA